MSKTTEIELTGLTGSSPIGALAAFGLLRLCVEIEALSKAKLGWRRRDDWFAVLSLPEEIDKETLVALLSEHLRKQPADVFAWSRDIRVTREQYQAALQKSADDADFADRRFCDYLAAFASEMAVDNAKGLVKPTAFYMTSGQQRFLSIALELVQVFQKNQSEKLNEVLFGPWLYRDAQHSLGWDPSAERMHALRHKAPTDDPIKRSVNGAIRLALEALPLFPVFPDKNGRLSTSGFVRVNRENVFQWPLWQTSIGLESLKTLLASSELSNNKIMSQRGIGAVYSAVRSESNKGLAIFRPAQLVWQKH